MSTLHSKNNFALALLTGDVFTPETPESTIDALLNGTIAVSLPTYFTIGSHPLPERIAAKVEAEEEICPNLHFLGKRGITKTSDGIRIVALGGVLDANHVGGQSKEQHLPFHTADDAKALKGANTADILLTSMWPSNVWNGSKIALEPAQQASLQSTDAITELCTALKPRYHFSASPGGFFYEREPFIHPTEKDSDPINVSRFISMAPFGNEAKAKSLYAFSLNKTDTTVPPGVTPSPFVVKTAKKRSHEDAHYDHGRHKGPKRNKRRQSPPPGPDRCYFCLSNPNLSTHMCCTIGEDAYVTIAKGPLPTPSTFADQGLSFPSHLIIIPLPHSPTIASMGGALDDPTSEAHKTYTEMTRFRESIQAMVSSKSSQKLGLVTWEISRDRNVHLIWQLVPIPADMITKGLAEAAFKVEAENQQLPAFTTKDLPLEGQAGHGDFFRVWLWADGEDKIKGKTLVMPLETDMRFDLQFGRRVLAKLMDLEDRTYWQDCAQTEEDETKDVEAFREAFKEWDFTAE